MLRTTPRTRLTAALVTGVLIAGLGACATASAYRVSPAYAASDYATGLPTTSCCHWGPIGVAFDPSDNLYVIDSADGNLYRFPPGGGRADDARLSSRPITGGPAGLAMTRDGRLYATLADSGSLVQLNPDTGGVIKTVVTGLNCATGIAVDPVSDDLFVSGNGCGDTVWRVTIDPAGAGTANAYASGLNDVDGLAFAPGGTLYAAARGDIIAIDGTNSSSPGRYSIIAAVPNSDGIAYADQGQGSPPFLIVNRVDGIATRVDLSADRTQQDIFSGGSRGDFTAVDSNGCLFATQSDRVVRIAPVGGCVLTPTTPGGGQVPPAQVSAVASQGGAEISAASGALAVRGRGARACFAGNRVTLRLSQRGDVRLRSAVIYVNRRRVRSVRGRAVARPIVLSHLTGDAFTIDIVARTVRGHVLRTSGRYVRCASSKVRRHSGRRHGGRRPGIRIRTT